MYLRFAPLGMRVEVNAEVSGQAKGYFFAIVYVNAKAQSVI
jgi:hypothetical protein